MYTKFTKKLLASEYVNRSILKKRHILTQYKKTGMFRTDKILDIFQHPWGNWKATTLRTFFSQGCLGKTKDNYKDGFCFLHLTQLRSSILTGKQVKRRYCRVKNSLLLPKLHDSFKFIKKDLYLNVLPT